MSKRSRWLRFRYWLSEHGAPRWLRIAAARPSQYHVARWLWGWPRRYALLDTLATWCGRTNYRTPDPQTAASRRRVRRELLADLERARATRCRCVLLPLEKL